MRTPLALLAILIVVPPTMAEPPTVPDDGVLRYAGMALECIHREYPNKIAHVLGSDGDARPPRELTPVFYGCFDWHSAVHGHWLLVRVARTWPESEAAAKAREALDRSFTPGNVAGELAYLNGDGRKTFERPYGLAWLLQLAAELREWDDPQAHRWTETLAPLEKLAAQRFREWLPKLSHPVRTGEHSQTAFALGLVFDWARVAGDVEMRDLLAARARAYYLSDPAANFAFEPGGEDFLSPALAEADLMRRVLDPPAFAAWLGVFLPRIGLDGSSSFLKPAVVTDRSDGKLVHLDGLNLSRAWMLKGIASGLPPGDPRISGLLNAANEHADAGLSATENQRYEGGHWLGSFAVYLVTDRGLERQWR